MRRLDGLGAFEEGRGPVVGVGADEPVEVLEAKLGGPEVVGPGLAGVPVGNVVVLAVPGGVVAVLLEHFGEGAGALRHERVIAGIAGAHLHDDAGGGGVVVAPREQRRARGRAESRGVELRVVQPRLGHPVQCGRGNRPTEGAGRAEAGVVDENEQNIRRALGRMNFLGEVRRGVLRRAPDMALERLLRPRQDFLGIG
jgi:hypothetical protein